MAKRRPAFRDDQLVFTFVPPVLARHEGDLAGLTRMVSSACARALKDDRRSREEIAGAMSALMGEDVSKAMLDAYCAESREDHNASFARFLALVSVTGRFDILNGLLARIGALALVGEEAQAARLGHLMAQRQELDDQIKAARSAAKPVDLWRTAV